METQQVTDRREIAEKINAKVAKIKAKIPQNIHKIAHVSVRDIRKIYLIKIEITCQFSNFLHKIFRIDPELNFDLTVGIYF